MGQVESNDLIGIQAELGKRDLFRFFVDGWNVMDPAIFCPTWHLEALCEFLQYVSSGDILRLIVSMPPRMSKSLSCSVAWPAWEWIQRPETQFLTSSYDLGLSTRDALKTRRLMESNWYQERWGSSFSFRSDENQKSRYSNTSGGHRIAISSGGRTTGEGGDIICFPAKTMVYSEHGPRRIEDLLVDDQVWSASGGGLELKRVTATHGGHMDDILKIRLSDGTILRTTPNHPIYTHDFGYIAAEELRIGNACAKPNMHHLRNGILPKSGPCCEEQDRDILFAKVLRNIRAWGKQPNMRGRLGAKLQELREAHKQRQAQRKQKSKILLSSMSDGLYATESGCSYQNMPSVWGGVYDYWQQILLQSLLLKQSRKEHYRGKQSSLRSWRCLDEVYGVEGEGQGFGERPRCQLHEVRNDKRGARNQFSDTPYLLRQDKSLSGQPNSSVPVLSREDAWVARKPEEVDTVVIESIERERDQQRVYCIDVEGNHNFFAEGVLVHNCLDDSHNAREAYSDVKREGIIEWYDNAMRSRLNNQNTGRIVHVGQRVHEADVIGHVLNKEGRCTVEEDGKWVHLVMPNEFRPVTRCIISLPSEVKRAIADPDYEPKIQFADPRVKEGDLLCPARVGVEATIALKPPIGMSLRDYNSQYQQDPAADDGLILKRSWWQDWVWPDWHPESHNRRPMPECESILQIYDTAFEEKEENDYSARTTWGVFLHTPEKKHPVTGQLIRGKERRVAILLDAWHDKVAFPELRKLAREAYDDWHPDWVLVEKKSSGHSLIQELRKSGVPVKYVDPKGKDKVLRAHVSSAPLEQGCVFWVPGHTDGADVIEECAKFPMGTNDDYVDTVVMLLAFLRRMGSIDYYDEDAEEMNLFSPRERRKTGIYG